MNACRRHVCVLSEQSVSTRSAVSTASLASSATSSDVSDTDRQSVVRRVTTFDDATMDGHRQR